jgi:hypothetical protein
VNITDYASNQTALADLIKAVVFGEGNAINGRQLLLLRNAIDDLQGIGHAATKRKAELQADAKREGLFSVDVALSDLSFADLHANISHWDCPDMTAEGEQVLTVYYASLEDEEGPYITLKHVAPAAPLVLKGEARDLVIGAGSDILPELVGDRQDEIADKVRESIRMLQGEARIDVAMAEAA